ncbi:N-acetylmuramic acid 6-phosphate etherase [Sphingomonas oleivorans]|uniref:N-acetylmuramic acid 6-phosphate etherase n=1 Tax=Sphingomonas oleivorans TaxID=1735121 RepID=A0A2T5FUM6_9SPHN|nr:N-acetylmuramic acid 6-phosphate etherase [Sphingomonas oleivorans]PTQ08228.1 N-acetylmuramic acid 6-phosphate etherase [Sphingomonas oleivorans]
MTTETVDPRFIDIDRWPTALAVEAMLEGQLAAMAALKNQVAAIAQASDAAATRLLDGGRLAYAGAGTSGRIAVQDGVELSPTYDWPLDRLVFLIAGGVDALAASVEGAEDDGDAARREIAEAGIGPADVLIGVAASGRTPYTVAAIEAARARGALTIGIANNPATPLLTMSDHALLADTGSEIIAGSTRMKAGTAQKAILNLLSTATMLRCGLVYRGLMVNMRVSNEKLLRRAHAIVRQITGVSQAIAEDSLARADDEIKKAVLLAMGIAADDAEDLLRRSRYNLRSAIDAHLAEGSEHAG